MKTVLITGGNGLIGSRLTAILTEKGYQVRILSRTKSDKPNTYFWDPDKGEIDSRVFEGLYSIVHLAGADISARRWTESRSKEIIESRVKTGDLLHKHVEAMKDKPKSFISTSAIGYYGAVTSNTIFNETDGVGSCFTSRVCKLWEQMADRFDYIDIRTVKLRVGIVLSSKSGALPKIMKPIKMGVGAALGSGNQYIPWIHIDDVCNMFVEAIENTSLEGVYNAVAPSHLTNKELTHEIALLLNKKILLPNVPSFMLYLIFGKMAEIFLNGSRVSSEKIINKGFQFKYQDIKMALNDLLTK